jgi:hypothetical protein
MAPRCCRPGVSDVRAKDPLGLPHPRTALKEPPRTVFTSGRYCGRLWKLGLA